MKEPLILGLFCKWCAGAAAEMAGVSRLAYPPNTIPIVVPCTGRISLSMIINALLEGFDGVLIGGCHTPNDCHYMSGNFKAFKKVYLLKKMLQQIGIEPERVRLEWISATEANKLVRVINEFTKQLRELGPLERS
ncbi:MAG: hydrogenase iron-sulfur subunit [Desulfurococcaceae archaeon]|uniref:Hydrogenase iron-sulfur subunit n=1 Tax=Staphylothermus marinus TaxID=2280 RepID=A0A7C4NN70_STAMA